MAKAVISPIEPFVSTSEVASECQRYPDQLVGLMSVNFAKFTVQQIQEAIRTQSKLRHCPGIKFHPNLQGVHPHSEKAQALFDTAEKEKMFVLVHGGITPIVYGDERRFSVSETLIAALKPFPSLKVIVAHVGSYFRTDDDFVEKVLQMPNIMVDTSGVSPDVILHALEILGPERVIYGSDWPYGTMRYSLKFVREAVTKYCSGNKNDCETVLARILSKNAEALLS
ncbi:MAG: hypothetical protein KCHDKBKB_02157 [Elusimicrobia bacterium]|nr:hypothetical protein [Elusimicrobiota bacterium]